MSSRHLRRLQRDRLQEQKKEESGTDSCESDAGPIEPTTRGNLFAFLSEDELDTDDGDADTSAHESDTQSTEAVAVVKPKAAVKNRNNNTTRKNNNSTEWDGPMGDGPMGDKLSGDEKELLIKSPVTWNTVNLDGLEESKELRERTGSVTGQLKRPAGRIIAPRKNWPKMPAAALGFTVEQLAAHEYRILASEEYIDKFHTLQAIISSADVAALSMFNKDHAEVIEGYLLLSDIVRQHSVADAAVMTEVALYFVEKALPLGFSWTNCTFKYDEYPDSRSIHLALFRHIQFLIRRASWTTALECAKILYNMDTSDPLMVVLFIDYIYLQTKNVLLHDELFAELGGGCRYPFLRYTNALLHQRMDCLDFVEASDVLNKRDYTENYTHSVFKLYFSRTCSAWKNVRLPSCQLVPNQIDMPTDTALAVYRHGLLSDQQNIHLAYPSSSTLSLDPFPPTTDGMQYARLRDSRSGGIVNMLRRFMLG